MRQFFALGLIACGCSTPVFSSESIRVYSEIKSLTYSEPMNIDGFIDHFSGKLESGTKALTHDSAEFGFGWGNWRFARIMRYDYQLKFTNDTAYVNYQNEHHLPLDKNRNYNLLLAAEHLRSSGFKIGYTFSPKQTIQLDIAGSWLQSTQFYSGYIKANIFQGNYSSDSLDELKALADEIQAIQDPTYKDINPYAQRLQAASATLRNTLNGTEGLLRANYHYYKPGLHEDKMEDFNNVDFSAPNGAGPAFDLSANWQFNDAISLFAHVEDLFSYIRWKDAPYSRGDINVKQAGLDALDVFDQFIEQDVIRRSEGRFFTSINPQNPDDPGAAIPGIRQTIRNKNAPFNVSNSDFVQHLPIRTTVGARYLAADWLTLSGSVFTTDAITFSVAEVEFWHHLSLAYNLQTQAKGVDFHNKYFTLGIASDKSQYQEAKFLSFNLGVNLEF